MANHGVLFSFFLLNIHPVNNDAFVIIDPLYNNPKNYKTETTIAITFLKKIASEITI